jgi:alpha-mannosidase
MEFLYRETEWLTSMAAIFQGNLGLAKQDVLRDGWKILLTHQFHDIIPGSSIHEVYEDSKVNYSKAEAIAEEVNNTSLSLLVEESKSVYTIINNAAWERDGIITIPQAVQGVFKDSRGKELDMQVQEGITYVRALNIPAMGFAKITLDENEGKSKTSVFHLNDTMLESPFYDIQFNEYGQIISLYDKENKVNILPEGEKANVLQMFEDKPLGNDAWDIDIFYQEKMDEVTQLQSMKLIENGCLRAVIRLDWLYINSVIKQDIIVYAHDRRIDFKTWVDFHEQKKIMKVAFPVDIRTTYATYDIQYGNVRRANHWNTSWDQAKFETVAHRWVDLSEHDYGVSLLNDCKYGHDIKGNVIRMTLLKSATHPDPWQDQGEHNFTYSLLPHKGDFIAGNTVKEAYDLNQPLRAVPGDSKIGDYSFLSFDNEAVEVDAVKLSEDGKYLVVRFHEYTGSKQNLNIIPGFTWKGYMEADLMERPVGELTKASTITLSMKPYEIKTLLIEV